MSKISVREPLSVVANPNLASTSDLDQKEHITFEYTWPLRISKRLVENEETLILNVSPPFTTSYNGVSFTWTVRLSDECVISSGGDTVPTYKHVFVSIYYKDGLAHDVWVDAVKIAVNDPSGDELFGGLHIGENEWTKGSGWPSQIERTRQAAFTEFINQRVDQPISINVELKLKKSLFNPMNYLPSVDKACRSQRIEGACLKFIDDVKDGRVTIPNLELLNVDSKLPFIHLSLLPSRSHHQKEAKHREDKFSIHRMVFVNGCDLVEQECAGDDDSPDMLHHIRSTFAHVYFTNVLMNEVDYFDDFVALLEGIITAHLPSLKREAERFIIKQVMNSSADSVFIKKVLLLSERYQLDVLKMSAIGVLAESICAHSDPPKEMVHIKHQLKHLASEISNCSSVDEDCDEVEEALVGVVVEDLQSLTRRIRRVSLSHSPSQSSASSNSSNTATPNGASSLSPGVSETRPFETPSGSRFKRVELDVL